MKTLQALDALMASIISSNGGVLAQLAATALLALLAWIQVRRTKMKTAADGAVAEVEALVTPRVALSGPEQKRAATEAMSKLTGIAADKLGDYVQAAWERRKHRESMAPAEPDGFDPDQVDTVPDRPAAKRPPKV